MRAPASLLVLWQRNMSRFASAPQTRLDVVAGGSPSGPRCGTGLPHDFYGIESTVVPRIIAWIKTNGCADAAATTPAHALGAAVSASGAALRCISDTVEPSARSRRGLPMSCRGPPSGLYQP